MKCESCKESVSPRFVAAIRDNKCPACGGKILSDNDYSRIFKVKAQLEGLGISDSILFSVSVQLSEKFTLVPRSLLLEDSDDSDESGEVSAPPFSVPAPTPPKGKERAEEEEYEDEPDDFDDMTEDQIKEIQEEWGLNPDTKVKMSTVDRERVDFRETLDPDLIKAMSNIIDDDSGSTEFQPSAERDDLLARARAARIKSPRSKIRRAT